MQVEMKPCPFCGMKVDLDEPDTLYPNGNGWIHNEVIEKKVYVSFREVPKEQWCYTMHCPETTGGCGVEISGDSKEEAIAAWNKRVN